MRLPDSLLELSADQAARLIALHLVAAVRAARERLGTDDPEALHDFRVALRRLRTALRIYRPQLRDAARRRLRRRLARVAAASRRSRDLEVHLAWSRAQRERLTPRQQAGVDWLLERMERRRRKADTRLARRVEREFEPAVGPLERRLHRYRATVSLDPDYAALAAAVLGARIRQLAGDLEVALGAVHGIRDEVPAHRARIAAKRLRYALEPVAGRIAGVEPILERLRGLQDELGDLHDSHVFVAKLVGAVESAARRQTRRVTEALREWRPEPAPQPQSDDPRPGLLALARRLRERGRTAFATVAAGWLNGAADPFFHELADLGSRLATRPPTDREIERKFLLRALPPAVRQIAPAHIRQGYLPGVRLVERLREVRRDGDTAWFRTVKSGTGVVRMELEEETSRELFEEIWPLTAGRRVIKRRYRMPVVGLTWEIDEFLDRELVLAEVELPSPATPVEPPDWLAPLLVREVTDEPAFSNASLAR